ncbi:MAG TPA: hypothetical protein VN812_03580 [Candidatus Acidoferrales bacterium]|nr:hypothetical protein [Candidatus Acidoferrales bacterium]
MQLRAVTLLHPHKPRGGCDIARALLLASALSLALLARDADAVELASADGLAAAGNAASNGVAVNADGSVVAFYSDATNLVDADTNGFRDVFVRDRQIHATERVSVSSAGVQANGNSHALGDAPAINGDGQVVAFYSDATNLVAGDANRQTDVFVRLRGPGETELVSLASNGSQGNGPSLSPSLSADGRFVAFQSLASNLVPNDTNNVADIFVRDRVSNTTERVCDQVQANNYSYAPSLSADGNVVAFTSAATNLVPHDTNHHLDVFVCNRETGVIELVSVSTGGIQGNNDSLLPALSADGRFVAFKSIASNLVPNDNNTVADVFVRDRLMGTTERISVNPHGGDANGASFPPSIDYAGRFVTFGSEAGNLVADDSSGISGVFVRDRQIGFTLSVDVNDQGDEADNGTLDVPPSVSGDGKAIGFISLASNLSDSDFNGAADVYVNASPFFCPTGICPAGLTCSTGMCVLFASISTTPTQTATPTINQTPSVTPTQSITPTPNLTATPSNSPTATVAVTATGTATSVTETSTPTATAGPSIAETETSTPTGTETATANVTPAETTTPTASATTAESAVSTASPTGTAAATGTATSTGSVTPTEAPATASPTAAESDTPTAGATAPETATPTETTTPTAAATATDTDTPTVTVTATASSTDTPTVTATASSTPTAGETATQTTTASQTATATTLETLTPTASDTPTPTATASETVTMTVTPSTTATASVTATVPSTPTPTQAPTLTGTSTPTQTSTVTETATNSPTPTPSVTRTPTSVSTATATSTSTSTPTATATAILTSTSTPTAAATATSTSAPTETPTPLGTGLPCNPSQPLECQSGQCVDGVCCGSASCPPGQFCNLPGSEGTCTAPRANGTSCGDGRQCTSGFCVDGVCCNHSSCPTGEACDVPGFAGTCAVVPFPNGTFCTSGTDCASGFCVDSACCSTASCPAGDTCNLAGSAGVCEPAARTIFSSSSGGCSITDGAGGGWIVIVPVLIALGMRRRRTQ